MEQFVANQRWVSETEAELGLGTVIAVDHRVVTVLFRASDEQRCYATDNAPLTRVRFAIGDTVESCEGWHLTITSVEEMDHLLIYIGVREDGQLCRLPEVALSDHIQFSKPQERLFTGQIDSSKRFKMRYDTLQLRAKQAVSEVHGLCGARAALIPHQIYIAHEVATRYAPRVLLADEVGLGKTIEAGLILHHQLQTGRINRALIIVPESLCFQWLVEMLRRFNLSFSLFDEERCESSESDENPFMDEQLVLCSLPFLLDSPERKEQVLDGEWDMLIVDEAHHLGWSEDKVSDEYQLIDELSQEIKAILLLTATPEQLGVASHFARLRLLDPNRFYSLEQFIKEEAEYAPVAEAADALVADEPLSADAKAVLLEKLGETYRDSIELLCEKSTENESQQQARQQLLDALLDRHGTGRVLFRNTRKTVSGFPERVVHGYPLDLPEAYHDAVNDESVMVRLHPEMLHQFNVVPKKWWAFDPRVDWLCEKLEEFSGEKILLICAQAQTVLELEEALRHKSGERVAVFHEGMSIVQRDRAGAYFADMEEGAQILLCSEIGSEGRNFQFAHHLILFDLPLNPDLLEQRIGRLDRIGQTSTIQIHVPYFEDTAQAILFEWYHQGLSAFTHTCPAGHAVFEQTQELLVDALLSLDEAKTAILLQETLHTHQDLNEALQKGRDHLLELSACRSEQAGELVDEINLSAESLALQGYMERAFAQFGIETENQSAQCYVARHGNHMHISGLAGLLEEGTTVTYHRQTALSREDTQFLTWEHPMVLDAMDHIVNGERGNTAILVIDGSEIEGKSSLLLETLFVVESPAPKSLQLTRYLPPEMVRVLLDHVGNDLSAELDHQTINESKLKKKIAKTTLKQIVKSQRDVVLERVKDAEKIAELALPEIKAAALEKAEQALGAEIQRLQQLREVNSNIREEEVEHLKEKMVHLKQHIETASLKLDALRVVLVSR